MADVEELPPSKLGTQDHWDSVYEREVRVFNDVGDEGEVWFGESSVTKMRKWASKNLPSSPTPIRVLECGSGNGTLLLSFLTSPAESGAQAFDLTGIDYSPLSADLSRSIQQARQDALPDEIDEDEEVINPVTVDWRTADLLRHDFAGEQWDLVLDKGTYDAIALSDEPVIEKGGRLPSVVYPEQAAKLVKLGGFFLITSCNFTEEETKRRWTKEGLGLEFHSAVPHPSFAFGGKQGTTLCTVAFKKTGETTAGSSESTSVPVPATNGESSSSGASASPASGLFACVDCGGTKTEVAIANADGEIVGRGVGGTGNMAEVGLAMSYEIICETILEAIASLPEKHRPRQQVSNGVPRCPLVFDNVWVGISGCDTQLDQDRMHDLLVPFLGSPDVHVFNDAHLLGGALLTHQCPWGIAVIAGTGSVVVALGQDANGDIEQIGRRGGTGYLLGDDGSAFDLARCAIRHAIDDFDEELEVEGGLATIIKAHFGVRETGEVLAKVYELDPSLSPIDSTNVRKLQISNLSRPILEAFTSTPPDPLAVRAVHQAAGLLVQSIVSLARQLTRHPGKQQQQQPSRRLEDAAIVMGGGVIRQKAYRDVVLSLLKEQGVVFGREVVTDDVAGEGAVGLAEKAKREAGRP